MAGIIVNAYITRHLVLLWAKSLHVQCMNLTETGFSQEAPCQLYEKHRTGNIDLFNSKPACWASGASSEAGGSACLSASVGPHPTTGEAQDSMKGGKRSSPDMETGEGLASSLAFFFSCRHHKSVSRHLPFRCPFP